MSKVFAAGELLVTDEGEVTIDEVVPKSRALLVHPEEFVTVGFDPHEPPPPPCAGVDWPDEVNWELYFHHVHHGKHHQPEEQLKLRIRWCVSSARTVIWQIRIP